MGVSLLLPHPPKKTKILTKILTKKMSKNSPKVASHDFFDLRFGISEKNDGDPCRKIFKSSYGDPFRDQKSFQKSGGKSGE